MVVNLSKCGATFVALALALSIIACSDDSDDDEVTRDYTEADDEIICLILYACNDAIDDGEYGYSVSGLTITYKLNKITYTETTEYDDSQKSVTILTGSTMTAKFDSDSLTSGSMIYDVDATIDGSAHSVYISLTFTSSGNSVNFQKIILDGETLTGVEGYTNISAALTS